MVALGDLADRLARTNFVVNQLFSRRSGAVAGGRSLDLGVGLPGQGRNLVDGIDRFYRIGVELCNFCKYRVPKSRDQLPGIVEERIGKVGGAAKVLSEWGRS